MAFRSISGWVICCGLLFLLPMANCAKSGGMGAKAPDETPPPADPPLSAVYEVTLIHGSVRERAVVYQSKCPEFEQGHMNMQEKDKFPLGIFRGRSISWTDFSFSGSVTVEVRVLDGQKVPPGIVKIFPTRHGIHAVASGGLITFVLDRPGQFSVEIGDEGYKNGLMIFANPEETDFPDTLAGDFRVFERATPAQAQAVPAVYAGLYFKKGVHNIGVFRVPAHIRNIYFEEGSWVYGALIMDGRPNVKIFGRGVLSAALLDYRESHSIEAINGSDDIQIEGIVVADFKHFSVRLIGRRNRVEWVKTIGGWTYNCDGISAFEGSTVRNCFIWANDDNVKVYRNDIEFSDIVCWQLNNGGVIQLSWGNGNASNVLIRRVDILHAEWNKDEVNRGVISCVGDKFGEGGMYGMHRNFLIEDLVTETPVPLVFRISPNPASPDEIDGMVFRNWNVKMDMSVGFNNYLVGTGPEKRYKGLVFDGFIFNGIRLNASNWKDEGRFIVDHIEPPEFR